MERFGDWDLHALIAVGGLGEVWRATNGDRTRALKRLHTHLARNEEGRTQFAVEQELATSLPRHPNVVHADEIGDVEGRPFIALEIAPGEDLRRTIAPPVTKQNPSPPKVLLPRARTLAIVTRACEAVPTCTRTAGSTATSTRGTSSSMTTTGRC
jgi:serine/threonine-protein kinase